ncbi:MAG: formimidoylglutamate deiminase [Rhizobiaceae bacterium]
MPRFHARQALLPSGWERNVSIEVAGDGRIEGVEIVGQSTADHNVGILLPAPVNAHSHAFQRAMAGLTERRGFNSDDSFWTWRQLMFRFLDRLSPDDVEAITAFVQIEMLEAGYATNVEFHYLHHQPGGTVYDNLSEMAERVVAATSESGIGLTLLPVHYQYGGCDQRELSAGQVRFGNDLERFSKLLESAEKSLAALAPDAGMGLAPHSLRAVAPSDLLRLVKLADGRPIHLHLAEQIAEVEEVQSAWGMRPVEWVLENADINEQWCMIHCTQMQRHESGGLAKSGAVAGLCPITESSLGDGIFDGLRWFDNGGKIAIGSDANIRISLSEELRTLEYSQRLRDNSRAAFATLEKSTARRLFDEMLTGGAQASGRKSGRIETGAWADLMVMDAAHVDLDRREGDTLLDCFVFAGDDRMITDVWSAGRHMVQGGRHIHRDSIEQRYRNVMRELGDAM